MIVQVTNTGHDLGYDHFDIQIPGGGVGYFNQGCIAQWNAGPNGWGGNYKFANNIRKILSNHFSYPILERYGGVSSEAQCSQLPAVLQEG